MTKKSWAEQKLRILDKVIADEMNHATKVWYLGVYKKADGYHSDFQKGIMTGRYEQANTMFARFHKILNYKGK